MPYELEKEKLSHKFLSASQITILLSFGLHVLVYIYGFPTVLIREKSRQIIDRVQTIELNPVEQSRLPDLEADWDVPPLESTPLDEAAPPFALPLPPNFNPNELPPIPIPPGYSLADIPAISSNIELPPLGITDLSALPSPPPIEDLDGETSPDAPVTNPQNPEPPPEEKPSEPKEPIAPPPEPEAENPSENKPTPEEIAAARQQRLDKTIQDVSASLQEQDGAASNEEARKNYVDWLSKIRDVEPEKVEIVGLYPRDACIRRLAGTSVYGVIVDENNTVVGLDLIKGAKYPIFNEQAARDIQNHDFQNQSTQIQPYSVTVNYEYDAEICPSLTLPSLRKQEETPPAPVEEETPTAPVEEETPPAPVEEETPTAPVEEETPPAPVEEETPPAPVEEETPPPPSEEKETDASQEETPPTPTPPKDDLPSLRDRLRNTPLPDNDTIRERLRKNPLPEN